VRTEAHRACSPRVLTRLRARFAGLVGLRALLLLACVLGGAALAAIAADAWLDLAEPIRIAAPWVLAASALILLAAAALQLSRLDDIRLARTFERTNPSLGNMLTNAVQLAAEPSPHAVGETLRHQAVERGRALAASLRAWPFERRKIARALLGFVVIAGAWLAGWTLFPDVYRAVVPRFLDPTGDHPPYSRLRIDVRPGDTHVLYGGEVEIRATASGRPVDKLHVVAHSANNRAQTAMFLAPDRSFFQTLANVREPTEYYVTDGQARSRRMKIGVRYMPRIAGVELHVTPPLYTGRPARALKLGDEPQSFLIDTRLEFRVRSNRPLAGGTLTLTPVLGGKPVAVALGPVGDQSALHPGSLPAGPAGEGRGEGERRNPSSTATSSQVVAGHFILTEPVVFSITITDVDGLACNEPRQGRIAMLPDNRPQIVVMQPGRHAVATPETLVPVRVQTQDDFGVTRVAWFRGFNKSVERPVVMKFGPQNGPGLAEADGAFRLKDLGVKPGDLIDYFFEAVDNYPRGPNVTTSRLFTLQIISMEQYQELLRRMAARRALFQPYEQLDAWLRRLAERARDLEKKAAELAKRGGPDAEKDALAKEMTELTKQLSEYREALGKLMEQSVLFDVEKSFRESLATQSQKLTALKDKMDRLGGGGLSDPKAAREVADELAQMFRQENEEVGEPFRHVASVSRMLARADAFTALAREQAELVQMLRRFQDRPSDSLSRIEQMELQELRQRQERVAQGLREFTTSLPQLLDKVPPEPYYDPLRKSVNQFLDAVRDARIQDDLNDASDKLSALNAPGGFPPARRAAENMDKLLEKCRPMIGQGNECLRFQPKLTHSLGNSLQQIIDAINGRGSADGRYGYGMFGESVSLYGPDAELAQDASQGEGEGGSGVAAKGTRRLASDARDAELPAQEIEGRVKLQRDAKFPLRYRELVGEYFRVIAESEEEDGGLR